MFEFFDTVVDWFTVIFNMIINVIAGIINFFDILIEAIKVPFKLIPFLNPLLVSAILIVTSIGVVKAILPGGNN